MVGDSLMQSRWIYIQQGVGHPNSGNKQRYVHSLPSAEFAVFCGAYTDW
jgi:hypothetical protein